MKLNDTKDVPKIIKKLDKSVAGLHHATDGKNIFRTTGKTPIANLPDDVTDLKKLSEIMSERYTRPSSQSLASIGANKDTVILNLNHLAGDGMFLQNLFTQLKSDKELDYEPTIIPDEEVLSDNIKAYTGGASKFASVDPDITRIRTKSPNELHISTKVASKFVSSHAKDLMTFKVNKRLKNMTEYYWINWILACSTLEGKINKCGVATCINLRPFAKNVNLSVTSCFSHVNATAIPKPDMTVGDIMKELRNSFEENVKKGTQYGEFKAIYNGFPPWSQEMDLGIDISLIGKFKMEGPFKDLFVSFKVNDYGLAGFSSYFGYSVEKKDEHVFRGTVRHSTTMLSDLEAQLLANSVHFGLENVAPNMLLDEALDLVKDYQNTQRKLLSSKPYIFF
ncbi:hypothetical protein TVAG_162730 [Trichomonas vaginalis G3]|uniref:Condensation domain-containing protein n=1 Tax=Trichomonas vaginalis (strain ATCC PRA-98 / G3) TaxID=412133 RepID=A2FV21_TRIV3|nr:hypothetical protein TVAGG3_0698750 [Trichomonas vaginalis G3]EAX91251.1 hypothetical protein TVAG_162730 [Trichomonas vaginalis G3]KAI5509100.1 hypothetical protein TVAGG3_0698750 [Trichomonas vaginalis G3]|eukprot:XP_001304181.1 hypothetical protein [Trichomonas vaginalis G3]